MTIILLLVGLFAVYVGNKEEDGPLFVIGCLCLGVCIGTLLDYLVFG